VSEQAGPGTDVGHGHLWLELAGRNDFLSLDEDFPYEKAWHELRRALGVVEGTFTVQGTLDVPPAATGRAGVAPGNNQTLGLAKRQ
jgi:hypothetical protein